jgi:hypothetical protein
MSVTNFMNLELPVVITTLGPLWASELNAALEVVDEHDHTSGKGKQVPVAGININDHLSFNSFKAYDLFSTQFEPVTTVLTGASNANSVSVFDGDLYYTNGAGNSVQITSGGSLVSTPGAVTSMDITNINSNLVISPSDTFVFIIVDTTSSRTITLPLASSVASGRIYVVKDASGLSNTNPITVNISGSDTIDGLSSITIDSNYSATQIIGNGAASWYIA